MNTIDPNFDRVAQWLDGEDIPLTEGERALADEIRRDQLILDAPIDRQRAHRAMDRARRRMIAQLARPARRKRWLTVITSTEAIAVAALLVVTIMAGRVANSTDPASLEAIIRVINSPQPPDDFDLVQDQLDALRAEFLADMPGPEDGDRDSAPPEMDDPRTDQTPNNGT